MDPKLVKWLRWLDVVKAEIQELVVSKYTFHEVQGMISANKSLHTGNSFYQYLTNTYVSHVLLGLRRQVKIDDQSISFARLLQEVAETPHILSREYFVALYKGSTVEGFANKDFDRFAGVDGAYIDPKLVSEDLTLLRAAASKCEDFADKRLAHRDKREPKSPPTYNEVDACIDLLDQLYTKYLSAFEAKTMDTLLPTWQYDWKSIFRTPWLPEGSEQTD